jgi:hypothetical protein
MSAKRTDKIDSKSLTMTVHVPGRDKPGIMAFDHESKSEPATRHSTAQKLVLLSFSRRKK